LLRGNVYGHLKDFVPLDSLAPDGAEIDDDDGRAVHIAVLENRADEDRPGTARLIGTVRLIAKSSPDAPPLPIEVQFPGLLPDEPLPVGSVEVSRLIAQHEDLPVKGLAKALLFQFAAAYIVQSGFGPTYAVVDESLERGLQASGIPVERLSEPRFIADFNSVKLPVEIGTAVFHQLVQDDAVSDAATPGRSTFVFLAPDRPARAADVG
jgi:N-acyl-L-homoserine lactone synthetase